MLRYRDLARQVGRGGLENRLRRGEVQRASRGIYALQAPVLDEDRLRALFLRLPEGSMLGFQSAAARYGLGTAPANRVHVMVPPGAAKPRIRGVVAHEAVLAVAEPVILSGVPCVPADRCVIDLARTLRRLDALPLLDAAVRAGLCDADQLAIEVDRHRGLRGVRQARDLVPLADGRAECRQESQLRLIVIDGRLPAPEPQIWVVDATSGSRYRIDLGYRERQVGLEYDGASHLDRTKFRYDRTRMNRLASQGWAMRYFTDYDLYQRPSGIVATVRALLS